MNDTEENMPDTTELRIAGRTTVEPQAAGSASAAADAAGSAIADARAEEPSAAAQAAGSASAAAQTADLPATGAVAADVQAASPSSDGSQAVEPSAAADAEGSSAASSVRHIGIDVGSTTVKVAVLDDAFAIEHSCYRRHHADIRATIVEVLEEAAEKYPDTPITMAITGSGGQIGRAHV